MFLNPTYFKILSFSATKTGTRTIDHVGFRSSTQPTLISYLLLLPKPEERRLEERPPLPKLL
ncbi:MAG: hypothetical protein ACLBM2_10240, partial [Dolichospermum sp.]